MSSPRTKRRRPTDATATPSQIVHRLALNGLSTRVTLAPVDEASG